MMHICMMHLSMMLDPDACMNDTYIYVPRSSTLMHVCMMHIFLILIRVAMLHICMMHLSMILDPDTCLYDAFIIMFPDP